MLPSLPGTPRSGDDTALRRKSVTFFPRTAGAGAQVLSKLPPLSNLAAPAAHISEKMPIVHQRSRPIVPPPPTVPSDTKKAPPLGRISTVIFLSRKTRPSSFSQSKPRTNDGFTLSHGSGAPLSAQPENFFPSPPFFPPFISPVSSDPIPQVARKKRFLFSIGLQNRVPPRFPVLFFLCMTPDSRGNHKVTFTVFPLNRSPDRHRYFFVSLLTVLFDSTSLARSPTFSIHYRFLTCAAPKRASGHSVPILR